MHGLAPPLRSRLLAATLPALIALPAAAAAQDSGGFLFGRPAATLGVYGGYAVPGAGSDVFSFTRERLTVDDGDFRSAAFGAWLGVRVSERLDLGADVAHAGSETASEFRDWVDQDDRPIRQTTTFSRTALTLDVRAYPWDRGRAIGRYVWIPRRVSPFVGAGAGLLWYAFEQEGDFVDFRTLDIFRDDFLSEGRTGTWYVSGGADVTISPRFLLRAEIRHRWASAVLDEDFVGFDPIDLSGVRGSLGLAIRL